MTEQQVAAAVTAMRDAGRSWTEIAARLKLPVAECRAAVAETKAARRAGLAHTETNERARGLLADCTCGHLLRDHPDDGPCLVCGPYADGWQVSNTRHSEWIPGAARPSRPADVDPGDWWARPEPRGCDTFTPPRPQPAPVPGRAARARNNIATQLAALGLQARRRRHPGVPGPREEIRLARARRAARRTDKHG